MKQSEKEYDYLIDLELDLLSDMEEPKQEALDYTEYVGDFIQFLIRIPNLQKLKIRSDKLNTIFMFKLIWICPKLKDLQFEDDCETINYGLKGRDKNAICEFIDKSPKTLEKLTTTLSSSLLCKKLLNDSDCDDIKLVFKSFTKLPLLRDLELSFGILPLENMELDNELERITTVKKLLVRWYSLDYLKIVDHFFENISTLSVYISDPQNVSWPDEFSRKFRNLHSVTSLKIGCLDEADISLSSILKAFPNLIELFLNVPQLGNCCIKYTGTNKRPLQGRLEQVVNSMKKMTLGVCHVCRRWNFELGIDKSMPNLECLTIKFRPNYIHENNENNENNVNIEDDEDDENEEWLEMGNGYWENEMPELRKRDLIPYLPKNCEIIFKQDIHWQLCSRNEPEEYCVRCPTHHKTECFS